MTSFSAHSKRGTLAKASLAMLLSFTAIQSAFATGTAANTDITNSATVNFSVGGVGQTAVTSNTTTFKVDRKVDITVTNGAATITNPNQLNVAAIYTVANTGNGPDSYTLTAANPSGAFTVTNQRVYQDNGATVGVFDGTDTLVTAPVALIADQVITFFVVSDIPISATNGQNSIVRLTATTTSTATVGADNPLAVDVVFADAGRNGTEFDDNQYNIEAAALSVVKSTTVLADPINCPTGVGSCGVNLPKALPGATVEYTIVVTNSGTVSATSVALSDNIPGFTTYVPASMTLNAAALTDAVDAPTPDPGSFTGTAVNVNAGTVASGGGTATVTFRVTIIN